MELEFKIEPAEFDGFKIPDDLNWVNLDHSNKQSLSKHKIKREIRALQKQLGVWKKEKKKNKSDLEAIHK